MKSPYNEMYEDKDERRRKKEEKRRERREEKFGVSTSDTDGTTTEVEGDTDFKIRPFIRAVDQLKSQVQSEIFNIDQTIKNRESGHQSASTYKTKFNDILEIILKINSKIELIKDKEGRNLEAGTATDPADSAEIKIFRGLYTTASNDFLAAQKEWAEKKQEADIKYLSDLKDTDTNNFIIGANTAFDEAKAMLNDLIRNSQVTVGATGATGAANIPTGETIKPSKKPYARDSKEGKIVIQVKNTIYTKFKKYNVLKNSAAWKDVYQNPTNVSGSFGTNTEKVIRAVKAGLATKEAPELKSDKGSDITPAFIAAINKMSESKENTSGRLITFENFIKSKMNEQFDEGAAGEELNKKDNSSSGSSGSSGTSGEKEEKKEKEKKTEEPKITIPEYSATPFANDTEGNKFRAWVIKNHADWAKTNRLDAEGAKDNRYIRKAYKQFGETYKKESPVSEEVKKDVITNDRLDKIEKVIKGFGTKTQIKLTIVGKEPFILFYSGKEYGFFYNTRKITYVTSGGKTFSGIYSYDSAKKGQVKFSNGKTKSFESVVKFQISDSLTSEKAETAQGKKAYVASTKGTKIVPTENSDFNYSPNIIINYTTKDKLIGMVTSSTKHNGKTMYKIAFSEPIRPNKNGSNTFDSGWVKADSVYLK
jgi:hypothetical protein